MRGRSTATRQRASEIQKVSDARRRVNVTELGERKTASRLTTTGIDLNFALILAGRPIVGVLLD
ncbi:MAG: hypothetical protein WA766_13990 [Candidatus Acidiferrales bacterium]|jgi:hypothetical protein